MLGHEEILFTPTGNALALTYLERKMGPRLRAVAQCLQVHSHADIGCDHALLPIYLLRSGRARRLVAVEKHPGPWRLAAHRLERYAPAAELRRGDGLEPLRPDEVDSLSLSGLGGRTIAAILEAHPERVPDQVVVQPNDHAECVQAWAERRGYSLRLRLDGAGWTVFDWCRS